MSQTWNLSTLFQCVHESVDVKLRQARAALAHPTDKGDASEAVWLELLQTYLPMRYQVDRAFVVDSRGQVSQQLDVVVYDRQYSPLVFKMVDTLVIPAEAVYAVFEAKQDLKSNDNVAYAQAKVASVRALHRTSLGFPTANGPAPPKEPHHILGGLLTLSSGWSPALGDTLKDKLHQDTGNGRLDLGCVADAGLYTWEGTQASYRLDTTSCAATRFIYELIARLQEMATVPMLDVREYAKHIGPPH